MVLKSIGMDVCLEKYATLEESRMTTGIFKIPGFLSCLPLYIKPPQTLVA